ncbi:TPA: HNH endonuclease [Legionella pneumophila]|nr:HNH endonuclease [Legionella pneumophila]
MIKIHRPPCPNPVALKKENYKHTANKKALADACFDKCMYCESKITQTYYGDIEHIKPKSKFSELEFEWDNLGFICARCNGLKQDKFHQDTPFIDPYKENPEDHVIAIGAFIHHKHGSERGEITISEIALNRDNLIERRQERIDAINKAIDACFRTKNQVLKANALAELKKESEADKEYSLCIKQLLITQAILE